MLQFIIVLICSIVTVMIHKLLMIIIIVFPLWLPSKVASRTR